MKNSDPIKMADKFSAQENVDFLDTDNPPMPVLPENCHTLSSEDAASICFYRIKKLSFTEDYPHREAFANVLMALDTNAFNFVYIITGNEFGVTIDIGVVRNNEENKPVFGKRLNAKDYGENIENIFNGNFGGSELERLKGAKLWETLLAGRKEYKNAGLIIGVPSLNEVQNNNQDYGFQGMDRLINSMAGKKWRLMIVCKRTTESEIRNLFNNVYRYYDEIAPYARQTAQIGISRGTSEGKSTQESQTHGHSYSRNKSHGTSSGKSSGSSSNSSSKGTTSSEGEQYGHSDSTTIGSGKSRGSNENSSQSLTLERLQKNIQEKMDYIDNDLLKRLRSGLARGLFNTAVYYMGGTQAETNRLRAGLLALFQGEASTYSPLKSVPMEMHSAVLDSLFSYQCCSAAIPDFISDPEASLTLASCPYDSAQHLMGLSTYLTADEVSIMAGLPQREVPGISVRESVEFGLNYNIPERESITLGKLLQKGRELEHLPIKLKREILTKHIFIAGVTGSGKTTTCHKLLKEARLPFLVIEPAKTEYRALLHTDDAAMQDLYIFTVGNENVAPLRLNPFELINGESLTAHIDMLKATFVSAFPMEASMPQILEEAIYKDRVRDLLQKERPWHNG